MTQMSTKKTRLMDPTKAPMNVKKRKMPFVAMLTGIGFRRTTNKSVLLVSS